MVPPRFTLLLCLALMVLGLPIDASAQTPGAVPQAAVEPQVDPLLEQVNEAIEISARRYLSAEVHTPWQIMHGILALRHDFVLKKGDGKINAYDFVRSNPKYQGQSWFIKTANGGMARPFTQPYIFQGHPNQFMAIMSLSKLPEDFSFETDDGPITVKDILRQSKLDTNDREEITWTLWAFAPYVPHDATWRNKWGEPWSMERLVQTQTRANFLSAACGGTHGLFALARARNSYLKTGQPLRGVYLEAEQKLKQYTHTAKALQNSDGSFSSAYFKGREYASDFNKRIETSGHTLEFLMEALSDEELKEPWVRQGVAAVARDLITYSNSSVKCGPLYHALDALVIYRERVSPKTAPTTPQTPQLTQVPATPEVKPAQPEPSRPVATTQEPAPAPNKQLLEQQQKLVEQIQAAEKQLQEMILSAQQAEKDAQEAEMAAEQKKEAAQAMRMTVEKQQQKLTAIKKELQTLRVAMSSGSDELTKPSPMPPAVPKEDGYEGEPSLPVINPGN